MAVFSHGCMLTLIKVLHTLIWAFFVVVIGYVLYSGIAGRITTYTWIGIGLAVQWRLSTHTLGAKVL